MLTQSDKNKLKANGKIKNGLLLLSETTTLNVLKKEWSYSYVKSSIKDDEKYNDVAKVIVDGESGYI